MRLSKLWSLVGLLSVSLVLLVGLLLWAERAVQAQPIVIATIPVGGQPEGVDINPNTNRIFVTNSASNTVSVIDGVINTVVATIPVSAKPAAVAVNPATNRIYVTHRPPNYLVTVIDGNTNSVLTTIPAGQEVDLNSIAVNPITNRIYATSFDPGGKVMVIDGVNNTVLTFITVAANPISVAVNPNTNRIYVGHGSFFGRKQITIIDGATNTPTNGPEVGLAPAFIGVNAITNRIYPHLGTLSNFNLGVMDGTTGTVITNTALVAGDGDVGVNPETDRIYVANNSSNRVSVVDGATNNVIDTIPVGQTPIGLGVNPNTQRVYVANQAEGTVSVIDDTSNVAYAKVVNQSGQPVAGAWVYRNGSPMPQLTNAAGIVRLDGLQVGDTLVALSQVYTQPTVRPNHGGWAYEIYQTSMPVATDGSPQPFTVVTAIGAQTLVVKPDNTLVLFNLIVSVEWDATAEYLQHIYTATQQAAAFLYDVSDGQMTFGQITIYDKAEHWAEADFQILAKNVVQPHAYVGGITESDLSHIIRVGRFWDGNTANAGDWSLANGFRTLVHEFGHYGLGLYDEYFGYDIIGGELAGQHQAFCTGPDNRNPANPLTAASIMDFHYTTSELADVGRWTAWCQQTAQHQLNQGEADWQTLQRRYGDASGQNRWRLVSPDQRVGVGNARPGPNTIPSALPFPYVTVSNTGVSPQPFPLVVCRNGAPYSQGTWITLYLGNGRAMDEGLTNASGQLDIVGAKAGDSLKVVSLDGTLSGSIVAPPSGCLELAGGGLNAQSGNSGPYLRLWPTASSGGLLDGLRLVMTHTLPADNLTYILTGPDNVGPSAAIPYNPGTGDHQVEVNFIPAAMTGQAKVLGSHANQFFDLNVDYRLQRATNISDTTLFSNDGNLALHLESGSLSLNTVNFLIASPWGLPGLPPSGLNIVGEAYEVTASNNVTDLTKPAVLGLHYDGAVSSTLDNLRIYRWNFQTAAWQPLAGELDAEHHAVITTITELGLYALMGISSTHSIYLPVVAKNGP
ncbi:MAG: hypothetical protein DPW09_02040 [Anaerolineae bacterium]|nr:hypothetical protein [Anaerolineae bacterium]MCQ3972209.1 hypothetical protein [Anaerolineae bacterium]